MMTTGTISVQVDGKQTVIEVPDIEHVTAGQLNALFGQAGVGQHVHCLSAEEVEQRRREGDARARQAHLDLIEALRLEEADDIADTMRLFGIVGRLDDLSLDDLLALKRSLEPDSF